MLFHFLFHSFISCREYDSIINRLFMYIVGNCFVHAERRVEKHAFKAAKSLRASQTSNRGRGGRGRGSRASRGSRGGAGGRGALAGREGADSDDADVAANHEKDLSEHTVPQLRAMLREKGLPTSGLKSVLIDRVTAALMDNSASGGAHGTTEASVGAGLGGASSQDQAAASAAAGENTNGSAAPSASASGGIYIYYICNISMSTYMHNICKCIITFKHIYLYVRMNARTPYTILAIHASLFPPLFKSLFCSFSTPVPGTPSPPSPRSTLPGSSTPSVLQPSFPGYSNPSRVLQPLQNSWYP